MLRKITRRDFLKGTTATAASLAVSSMFLGGTQGMVLAEEGTSAGLPDEILTQLSKPDNQYQPGIRMATQNGFDGSDSDMLDIVEEEIREARENGLSSVEIQTNGSVGTSAYIETLIRYYELGNELGIAMELRVGGAG
ncbi:MAG: twin-arginine translocation signal domain-containing protein, partial [Lachnospiraceae bacterium]|nr:twin-arginine translocation signal domain-containing protein [Lachnospiraceae bacterium]